MTTIKTSEEINQQRRSFLGNAAMAIAATQLGMFGSAKAQTEARRQMCPRLNRGRTRRSPH